MSQSRRTTWSYGICEGWTGSGYTRTKELEFPNIARRLKRRLTTVFSQYRSAFEMIVGHEFSPELWCRVFAPLRFAPLLGDPATVYSAGTRRRLSTPTRRPVPEAVLESRAGQDPKKRDHRT